MNPTQMLNFVVGLVKPHFDYVIDHDRNVEKLRFQRNKLGHVKQRVQHKVDEASSKSQKIEADVDEWLKRAEEITEQARKLVEADAQKCFYGLCPNFIALYNPSKKASDLAQLMADEVEKGNGFPSVAYTAPLLATPTTSKGFQTFPSRTSTVTKILEEFKKANINMIGVYGMPGVGKSTFVQQVANQAKEEKLFDEVAVAEVKKNPDVKSIQNKLALSFGKKLDKTKTIDEMQLILRDYMEDKKKKILIILDDIWEVLDLKTLGVEEDYCKVLLTSRNREILRSDMGTQNEFLLDVLTEEETWSFFEKKVGDAVKHPDTREVATQIAKRCGGLPFLVERISTQLSRQPIHSWTDALRRLNRSDGKGSLLEKLREDIEWSYDQLGDEDVKSLFLICGMISYQYLHLSYLLKYIMGLKLFEGIDTMEKAYDSLQSSLDKLKESCLFLDFQDSSQIFTMHDLTREVARKIASKDQHFLSFRNGNELEEWPNKELLQKCAVMSFDRINKLPKLPQELECPSLQLFTFYSIDKSLQIPPNFFKKTEQLKVLDLTYLCIPSLPPSIKSLASLQSLCFYSCELRDIAIVGELTNLEILCFAYSKFKQLPKEIGRLTKLRCLDLTSCPELEVIYPDVIKSLTRLEELNMNNNFNKWETDEASNDISERSNARLSELKHLPNLTTLGINIKDANELPINFFSEKLKHFKIFIGDVWDWDAEYGISKTLKLKLSQRNQSDQGLLTILKRCEDLSLDVFEGVKNIVYDLDMDGFQRLKKLRVQNNPEISYIINSNMGHTWIHSHAAFPVLEELSLCNLVSLENICSGQLAVESFRQLKVIKVQNCFKLKNLFSLSTISHFSELEKIEVEDCINMKEIIVGEKEKQEIEANDPIKLHWLQSLSLQGLPKLTCFASKPMRHETSTSSDPQQLFNDMVVFPKLEMLKLSSIPLSKLWDGHYSARMSWIQNLTSLIVDGCDGLSFLCSSSMAIDFVQLKNLEICRCQNMVKIISTEEAVGNFEKMDKMFSKLQTLKLEALGKLEIFCTSPTYIEFPCLQLLDIKDCTKLGSSVIDSTRRKNVRDPAGYHLFDENVGFPNLEDLVVEGLHKLTTIWHTQLATDSFYKLTSIWVKSCPSLIHITGPGILKRLPSLKKLYVEDCESVQEVFNGDDDQSEVFRCQNLLEVVICKCKSLKIVFPARVARVLVKLETLRILECEILELIISEEDQKGGEIIPKFVFPSLTLVHLCELPKLRSFYPGLHTSMWPSLRKLWLRPSYEHENLAEEYSIFQHQQHEHDQLGTPTKLPILLFQKGSFISLEELNLWFRDGLELPLEFLETSHLHINIEPTASAVGLSIFLKKFHNLQLLELNVGTMEEIFINEGALDGEEQHVFAHLKSLEIYKVDNLLHVWKENSNVAGPVFPNLEILKVDKCGRLKSIMSSAISFRNLVKLYVVECHGLKHLITCTVAKSFVQLQSLVVENCEGMLEIVASDNHGEADRGNEIAFSGLKDLKLSNLPNLKGFCSLNYDVKFPLLITLRVISCLEMKISTDGVLLKDSKHEGVALVEEKEEEDDHNNIENEDNVRGERFQEGAAE